MKITEILTKEEIKNFTVSSDLKGFQALVTTWGMIGFSFYLYGAYPSILTFMISITLLGGRHLALAILMHDASHYSLFKTRWLNDFIGSWFCAFPTWQHLARYRVHHIAHHKYAGRDQDPDLSLVQAYPTSKKSLIRKLVRDAVGVTGLKRIFGLLAMDFGFIKYTAAGDFIRLDQSGRRFFDVVKMGAQNLYGVVITNSVLFLIFKYFHHTELYLLWVVSYLTTFSVFVRIRSIAEHACTQMDLDPLKSTRTTYANLLARVTVAPHYVNYHLEHHLLMTVPHYKFRELHNLLDSRDFFKQASIETGYLNVLKMAVKGK